MKLKALNIPKILVLLASTLIVLALVISYLNMQRVKSTSDNTLHTQNVINLTNELLIDIIDKQNGVRGYIISGNERFLQPYNNSISLENEHFSELIELTKDNAQQVSRLDTLKRFINVKNSHLINTIESIRHQKFNDEEKIAAIEKSKILTDKIRATTKRIIEMEYEFLEQRKQKNEESEKNASIIFIMLTLGIVFILLIYYYIISIQAKKNKLALEDAYIQELKIIKLKAAKDVAEETSRISELAVHAKQQFLSNMSHEIRTPMNSIVGFTNVLLKTNLTDNQKEYLQAIKTSGESLNVLINDILDLAKVDAGKMTFEKRHFHIEESITSMLHLFDLKAKEKGLEIVKEFDKKIPSILIGDPIRLHQIILNLMSNAVKFTDKGKIIVCTTLLNEDEEKATVEIAITDTGIGIAADKIKGVFNLFEQATVSTSRSYGGTGLGLAIAKQLVEAQGGSIGIKSNIGEGATFSFILSFDKNNREEITETTSEIRIPDSEIKNLRVLVAEDVPLNQLLIKTILSDFGFEYEVVANGKLAVEKLQTNTYDIILMDLMMPEMNGYEATEYIRKTMNSKIPIIALTADVTSIDVAKCKAIGMDDYISKPIDEELLYRKMISFGKHLS